MGRSSWRADVSRAAMELFGVSVRFKQVFDDHDHDNESSFPVTLNRIRAATTFIRIGEWTLPKSEGLVEPIHGTRSSCSSASLHRTSCIQPFKPILGAVPHSLKDAELHPREVVGYRIVYRSHQPLVDYVIVVTPHPWNDDQVWRLLALCNLTLPYPW